MTLDHIRKAVNIIGKGAVAQMAPSVAKGGLIEILKIKGVDRKKVEEWVLKNVCLWDILGTDYQERLKLLSQKVGRTEWLTAEWVITSIKGDMPAVASLFIGWKKANNWLKRQVEIIKEKAYE